MNKVLYKNNSKAFINNSNFYGEQNMLKSSSQYISKACEKMTLPNPEGLTAIGIRCTRLWNDMESFRNSLNNAPFHLLSSTWK